jgi:hypothetical protein
MWCELPIPPAGKSLQGDTYLMDPGLYCHLE